MSLKIMMIKKRKNNQNCIKLKVKNFDYMKLISITGKKFPKSDWSKTRTCWDISSINENKI